MKKTKLLAGAVVAAIGGLAMTSIASAEIPPTVESNGDLTVCGIEYVSDENGAQGCITIQGMNVGATATGAGPSADSSSYGYYFQWGDNNTGYTEQNWNSSNIQPDNAWGGGNDNDGLVYPVENESERKGPCDEGYHVPSKGEWSALMDTWAETATNGYINSNVSQFYIDFQIPFGYERSNYDGYLSSFPGSNATLWSSSPRVGEEDAWRFGMNSSRVTASSYDSRAFGFAVRCFKDSSVKPTEVQIVLSVNKGALRIGAEIGNVDLGEVNVSNSAQELSGSLGEDSLWVEDMKGAESGYYTTISVTDLTGTVPTHVISANNVYLKTAGNEPSYISGATVSDSKVVFSNDIKSWHNNWAEPVTYFNRQNTATADAGRVGKWGDNLQIKVNIPAHTPSDTYRGTITYTLYDLDS